MTTTTRDPDLAMAGAATSPHDRVFEAATAEDALAEVTAVLGPDAEIVSATKTLRGGFKGFFAREVVQLTARPRLPAGTSERDGSALGRVLTDLAASEEHRETAFGTVLRERLAEVAPAPPRPDPVPESAPPVAPPLGSPPTSGAPDWSVDNLLRLGLPELVVAPTRSLDPADDLAWIGAIAGAVASLCRPLPAGDVALVGPRAHRLGAELGLRDVRPDGPMPPLGDCAIRMTGSDRDQGWLAGQRRHRWVHLVVGGAGWRFLLLSEPLAVSWVGAEALPEALRCAAELGLVLGYGMTGRADARRANPVDVALAVRALVPRR